MWSRSFLFVALIAFAATVCESASATRSEGSYLTQQKETTKTTVESRGLFNLLSLLFAVHPPCPKHGPLSHHCHDHHHDNDHSHSSGGGSSNNNNNNNDGDGDDNTSGGDDFDWNDPDFDDYNFGQFEVSEESTGSGSGTTSVDDFSIWMLVAAGAAAFVAIGTVLLGQRTVPVKAHPLAGSVARRMELFGNFADSALCSTTDRPDRVVEMTATVDDYRLV